MGDEKRLGHSQHCPRQFPARVLKANCSAIPRGKKNVNLLVRASEEREEAIQAATKAVSEGQSNASVPLIRLDRLAVPRDALLRWPRVIISAIP